MWNDDLADRSAERPPPPDDAPDLDWLLFHQDGVLTRGQALAHLSPDRLRHRVGSGRWQRVRAGLFVAHNGPLTDDQRLWAAVLVAGPDAVASGLAAAIAGGLRRDRGRRIDILVPANRRPNQPGRAIAPATAALPIIAVHRTTRLPDKDLMSNARPPRTALARSLVDAAQWASTDDEARAVITAACRQRLIRPENIGEVAWRMPRARRRALVLETVGYVATGAEAPSEISFDKLCRAYRLPLPERQVQRVDRAGRRRYLDAEWRRYGVVAEVDGGVHLEPEPYWADMFRQNALWIHGEVVLRFPAWAIDHRPHEVATQLRDALRHGGWTP